VLVYPKPFLVCDNGVCLLFSVCLSLRNPMEHRKRGGNTSKSFVFIYVFPLSFVLSPLSSFFSCMKRWGFLCSFPRKQDDKRREGCKKKGWRNKNNKKKKGGWRICPSPLQPTTKQRASAGKRKVPPPYSGLFGTTTLLHPGTSAAEAIPRRRGAEIGQSRCSHSKYP